MSFFFLQCTDVPPHKTTDVSIEIGLYEAIDVFPYSTIDASSHRTIDISDFIGDNSLSCLLFCELFVFILLF